VRKVDFDKANRKELSASLEQKLSHCGVLGKANGPVESVRGLGCFPEPLQEVGANCPVGLKSGDIVRVDPIQYRQSCVRSVRFADRRCVPGPRAEGWGNADNLFVKQHNRCPLGPAAARSLSMHRLNRGLELKPAGAAATRRFGEM
jgi:hypothetical protein